MYLVKELTELTTKEKNTASPRPSGQDTVYKQGANPTVIGTDDVTWWSNETLANKQTNKQESTRDSTSIFYVLACP